MYDAHLFIRVTIPHISSLYYFFWVILIWIRIISADLIFKNHGTVGIRCSTIDLTVFKVAITKLMQVINSSYLLNIYKVFEENK